MPAPRRERPLRLEAIRKRYRQIRAPFRAGLPWPADRFRGDRVRGQAFRRMDRDRRVWGSATRMQFRGAPARGLEFRRMVRGSATPMRFRGVPAAGPCLPIPALPVVSR
jgi:hypothetical protein